MTQVRLRLEPAQAGWAVVQLVGSGGAPSGGLNVPGKGVVLDLVVPATALAANGTVVVELLPTCRAAAAGEEVQSAPGVWVPAGVTPRVTPPGLVYRADLAAGGRTERLLFSVPSVAAGVVADAVDYAADPPGAVASSALAVEVAARVAANAAHVAAADPHPYVRYLQAAMNPDLLIVGAITRDANGAATSAPVVWPDGTAGTYTATTVSPAHPGAVDAYTVTYGSPVTSTYTQPAVTRDASGAVTTRPGMTVA